MRGALSLGSTALVGVALFARPSTSGSPYAATLTVGPGKMYATPCAAIAAASDGDRIEIDAAGTYSGDVCSIAKNQLTLVGVNGRPKIDAAGKNYGGKGTWVISGNDTTVVNIEFLGAAVPDKNGAGIRLEGQSLTVSGCYFHDNENGILTGAGGHASTIDVAMSEFANNGAGDGFSHNMYIGHEGVFRITGSYSHDAKNGHLVKSRAETNYILANRLSGENGTSSYELDLPNGGQSYVIGNLIEQGPNTQNSTLMAYGEEGTTPENPVQAVFVVNNTFVNDRPQGGTFIAVGAAIATPAVVTNNIFLGTGTIASQASAQLTTNFSQGDPKLLDRANYDYRLQPDSPCINGGSDPGSGLGLALTPAYRYEHRASYGNRGANMALDIGAYEYGDVPDAGTPDVASPMPDAATRDSTMPTPDGAKPTSDASTSKPDRSTIDVSAPMPDVSNPMPEASTPEPDALMDASSAQPNPSTDGGCGCELAASANKRRAGLAVGHSEAYGAPFAFGAAVLLLRRSHRRRSLPTRLKFSS